jgi:tripartite-type tricarboxylate transporter receptor subunit TctC
MLMKKIIATIFLLCCVTVTQAKNYKIYVANPPGSSIGDAIARKISEIYSKKNLGNALVVVNVPGGNHVLAINEYKKQSLALIVSTSTMHVYNYLYPEIVNYSDDDFNHLGELGELYSFYFTHPGSGINKITDVLTVSSKDKPMLIGSHANNTLININSIKKNLGAPVEAVTFKSPTEMITSVVGKNLMVGLSTGGGNNLFEMAKAGKVKILGSTASKSVRIQGIEIPSVSTQLKVPQYNGHQWISISPGNSNEHLQLANDIKEIMSGQEFQSFVTSVLSFPSGTKEPPIKLIIRMRNSVLLDRDLLAFP